MIPERECLDVVGERSCFVNCSHFYQRREEHQVNPVCCDSLNKTCIKKLSERVDILLCCDRRPVGGHGYFKAAKEIVRDRQPRPAIRLKGDANPEGTAPVSELARLRLGLLNIVYSSYRKMSMYPSIPLRRSCH